MSLLKLQKVVQDCSYSYQKGAGLGKTIELSLSSRMVGNQTKSIILA
jgi:hypothetical protein